MKEPLFKLNDRVRIITNGYTKDIGINDLIGKITKILYKSTGLSYNIVCGDDHICCIAENFLIKEGKRNEDYV